jgi:uncharacterized protein YigE (DUF2233 family)
MISMKWWLLLLGIMGVGVWYALRFVPESPDEKVVSTPLPSPRASGLFGLSENEAEFRLVEVNQTTYRYGMYRVAGVEAIRVGLNVDLASDSAGLALRSMCVGLTSAAFYDTNNRPLGMLVSGGKELAAFQKNVLLNGVLGFDRSVGEVVLVSDPTESDFVWAVQAGPILVMDQLPKELVLKNDQQARRIVAGLTEENELVVLVIVAADSLFSGPSLVDMPEIVMAVAEREQLSLTGALNLDGGTASAFLTPTLKLKELKPIGSYLCLP